MSDEKEDDGKVVSMEAGLEAARARQEAEAAKTKLRIRPLGDRVWVKRVKPEERIGRMYIPDLFKDQPQVGRVLAVGPGPLTEWPEAIRGLWPLGIGDIPGVVGAQPQVLTGPFKLDFQRQRCSVKAGDVVLFGRFSGAEIPVVIGAKRHDVFLLREEEILAVLEEVAELAPGEPSLD